MSATLDPEDDGIVLVCYDSGKSVYHTNTDCDRMGENTRPAERETLPDHYSECDYCAGDLHRPGENTTECPYCGDLVGQLPHHLVNDCEAKP